MNILLSAYACEPNRGSEPGFGWNWAYHLAERGHNVHLLTRIHSREKVEHQLAKLNSPNLICHFVDIPDFLKPFLRGHSGVYLHYMFWQYFAFIHAKNIALSFDVVHHVTWGSLHFGSHLWKLGYPFVMGPIGGGQTFPLAFKRYLGSRYYQELVRNFATNYVLPMNILNRLRFQKTTLVLATNSDTTNLLRHLGAKRVEFFLDSGLPDDYFPPALPQRTQDSMLRIVWVGQLYPRKALQLALEAVAAMQVPFKLTIVGDGVQGKELGTWIEKYGLSKKVDWWGKVDWFTVKKAYLENDVFLFTSLRDSFGSQVLEAMAQGLPVVALNHHGVKDVLPSDIGIKIAVTTPDEVVAGMAKALDSLYLNPEQRWSLGKKSYEYAQTSSWKNKVLQMEEFYRASIEVMQHQNSS